MKKLLLLFILVAFSSAGITSYNGIGLSPAKVYNTGSTSVNFTLMTNYSRIELDATSQTLNYELTSNYYVTANRIYNPIDGQILTLIVTNKNYPITITCNSSVMPSPTSSVYTFSTTGNNVTLIYSKNKKMWYELSRKGI